jgi:hypothetical protein
MSKIDWKKVAQCRLAQIKCLERQCARLRSDMAADLERELVTQLHAHCVPRNVYEAKLKGIASFVAERLKPKIPKIPI